MPLSVWIIFFVWFVLTMVISAKADADFVKRFDNDR